MSLPRFEFAAPRSVAEACKLLDEAGEGGRLMAGGTDLLIKLGLGTTNASKLIGLRNIEGLDRLTFDRDEGLTIGAMALLSDIERHNAICEHYPAISEAALETATVQIRNMATLVGNICNASPCADNAQVPMALGADVALQSSAGKRRVPLDEFFTGPGQTVIKAGEMMTEVRVPPLPERTGAAYKNIGARSRVDITSVSVAAVVTLKGDSIQEARLVLGGVAPTPLRVPKGEAILAGAKLTDTVLAEAAAAAEAACKPICDVRATADYRRRMVGVLTQRALRQAYERAGA